MSKNNIIITSPNGSKKIIVGKTSNNKPVKTKEVKENNKQEVNQDSVITETRRAKPMIIKAGLTKERNPYKYGGKANSK